MNACHFGDCRDTMRLTDAQVAYLAGLIDGEGSLECQKQIQPNGTTHCYKLRLSFVFATAEPLQTISLWLGLRVRCYPATSPNRSPRWRAEVPKGKTVALLNRALPHLILKRRQAELVLAIEATRSANSPNRKHVGAARFTAMPLSAVSQMDQMFIELRSLKSNKRRMSARVNLG
jgi:hypothetical protein